MAQPALRLELFTQTLTGSPAAGPVRPAGINSSAMVRRHVCTVAPIIVSRRPSPSNWNQSGTLG